MYFGRFAEACRWFRRADDLARLLRERPATTHWASFHLLPYWRSSGQRVWLLMVPGVFASA